MGVIRQKNFAGTRVLAEEHGVLKHANIHGCGLSQILGPREVLFPREANSSPDDLRFCHVFFTIRGRGEIWTGDRWSPVSTSQICAIPSGVKWGNRWAGEPWAYLFVRLYTSSGLEESLSLQAPGVYPGVYFTEVMDAYERLYQESVTLSRDAVLRCFSDLLAYHATAWARGGYRANTLGDLWGAVLGNLDRPWALDSLAEAAGTNIESLRQRCKTETGMTPIRYVTNLRMEHAAKLLLESSLGIAEIGRLVGYDSPFHFSTAFKRNQGCSPRAWRKRGGAE